MVLRRQRSNKRKLRGNGTIPKPERQVIFGGQQTFSDMAEADTRPPLEAPKHSPVVVHNHIYLPKQQETHMCHSDRDYDCGPRHGACRDCGYMDMQPFLRPAWAPGSYVNPWGLGLPPWDIFANPCLRTSYGSSCGPCFNSSQMPVAYPALACNNQCL